MGNKKIAVSASDQKLFAALIEGSAERVVAAIRQGADPGAKDESGRAALCLAVQRKDSVACEALLAAGAKANVRAPDGMSALMMAARGLDAPCCQVLLAHGADVHARSPKGRSALHFAAEGAGWRPEAALMLVEAGSVASAQDDEGVTPLMLACQAGSTDGAAKVVEAWIKAGAGVGAVSREGSSALRDAARSGNEAACASLLRAGADPRAKERYGRSALEISALSGAGGACHALLASRASDMDRADAAKAEREGLDWHALDEAQEMERLEALTAPRPSGIRGTEFKAPATPEPKAPSPSKRPRSL